MDEANIEKSSTKYLIAEYGAEYVQAMTVGRQGGNPLGSSGNESIL